MAFTLDGPRGPRYKAKSGAVLLAKKSGNPIMPFVVELKHSWSIGSWDRLQIPRPFTRARLMIGDPIYVDGQADDEELKRKLAELQLSLDTMVSEGANWKVSG